MDLCPHMNLSPLSTFVFYRMLHGLSQREEDPEVYLSRHFPARPWGHIPFGVLLIMLAGYFTRLIDFDGHIFRLALVLK